MSFFVILLNVKKLKISGGFYVKLDDEDYEYISKYKWKAHKSSSNIYARRNSSNKGMIMHRVILKAPKNMLVHHKNGNTLDNRKNNLILCTDQENKISYRKTVGPSGYRGVVKCGNKWTARMTVNYKNIYLGLFSTPQEAALKRDEFAKSLYGDLAQLNFPQ